MLQRRPASQIQRIERLALLPAVIIYLNLPSFGWSALQFPCLFKYLFAIECPGCGMTKALAAILKGDFAQATEFNFLAYPVAFGLICVFLLETLAIATGATGRQLK